MFVCKKCKSIDKFELMFNPDYKGKGIISKQINEQGQIVINVDGYTFIPDIQFMNAHAVCSYCGEINCWEYSFE